MSYDLLIRNGTVVDGTGAPAFRADVAIAQGKIAEIGNIGGGARRVIDARDLIVAPGFVDPHTHYDAQICWDPLVTSTSWHGVTTVIMGNCGVGIAPCKPEVREVAAWDLVNVEGIPFDALSKGISWDWVGFGDFMDAAARRKCGVNLGFLAPLTPFRHFVMGEESMDRAARPDELARIRSLLHDAIAAGAFGFSTTTFSNHIGYQARPLACRLASHDELMAYAGVLKELGRGAIEIALTKTLGILTDDEYQLLDDLLTAAQRPVTWLLVSIRGKDGHFETLRKAEPLIKRGGVPQVSAVPIIVSIDLRAPGIFASMESWRAAFNKTPEQQKNIYASQEFRGAFREELKSFKRFKVDMTRIAVDEAGRQELKPLEGMTVDQVARRRGKDPVDTFLDIALEDDLATRFTMIPLEEDRIHELIGDPRTIIGLSDGGAHVNSHCEAGYPTYLLGHWVRDKKTLTLEHAVKRITSEPADLFGIVGRGRLAPAMAADVTIFDFDTIGPAGRQKLVRDLPGSGERFIVPANGIEYTIVNGEMLYEHGQHSGALPGKVLRSQRIG
ncbi:MAG TPA: amidohydrolase family protein [Candidatus Binataceae bacterium]|nr:amidohydrolase family protein [Candidatus Binataceae bacterium]